MACIMQGQAQAERSEVGRSFGCCGSHDGKGESRRSNRLQRTRFAPRSLPAVDPDGIRCMIDNGS